MRILGISGSLRRGSHNRTLLRAASAELPAGVDLVEWDGLADLPAFNEDLERTPPPSVRAFLGFVADADALLIATPEYNSSVPGALKNALDWASRPFPENVLNQKPSLVIGAAPGYSVPSGRRPRCARRSQPAGRTCSMRSWQSPPPMAPSQPTPRWPTRESGRACALCSATPS